MLRAHLGKRGIGGLIVGAVLTLYGLPGIVNDGAAWWRWSNGWNAAPYIVTFLGIAVLITTSYVVLRSPSEPKIHSGAEQAAREPVADSASVNPIPELQRLIADGNRHLKRLDFYVWKGIPMQDIDPEAKGFLQWSYRVRYFIDEQYPHYGRRVAEIWEGMETYVVRDIGVLSNVDAATMRDDMRREFDLLTEILEKERQ